MIDKLITGNWTFHLLCIVLVICAFYCNYKRDSNYKKDILLIIIGTVLTIVIIIGVFWITVNKIIK